MICEMRLEEVRNARGMALWSGLGIVYFHDYIIGPNMLDLLWQKINRVPGTISVFKDENVLRTFSEGAHDMVRLTEVFLFSGTAKEVVQQLRPYMVMMEGA